MITTTIPVLDQFLFYLLMMVFGSLWTIMRAYELYQQLRNSKYRLVLSIIESAVQKTYDTYTREIKKSREDGKLTPEERQKAFQLAMETAIDLAKNQNLDIFNIVRREFMPYLIQRSLQKLKLQKAQNK
ncbi:MAG TPA: hypothetical protein PLT82_11190 [Candidatus Hydrogenedens sp.]|nr:hypothetical protein [Candidatus Hydrogenedens sp.]HOK09986.1 hypothetical protein [Candidatus Hydrogenedens sp.]HOL19679.1 hypothetical protein [Candidatus Hydrogenedens sp.]HPP59687.1 hypothetical protein [Candidatus Hydrogenedens sp.]